MLHKLRPSNRYRFVRWCCRGCRVGRYSPKLWHSRRDLERLQEAERFGGDADRQVTNECYGYLWSLATQYELDLARVIVILDSVTRGRLLFTDLERYPEMELVPCGSTPS